MTKPTRKIIFVVSDTHGGYKLGLATPSMETNEAQKLLYETYQWGIDETKKFAGNDEIIPIHLGDITHGLKHIEGQMTTKMSDQIRIAVENFMPLMTIKNVRKFRLAIGTGAHNFGEGSAEDLVTEYLQAKFPKKDIKTVYHGLMSVDGMLIDYAHHGPNPGSRNWLRGNVARLYLKSLMMDEVQMGRQPPHLVLRGHYHSFVKEWASVVYGGERNESWIIVMPSLSLAGDWIIQATRSNYVITIGTIAIEVINGKITQTLEFIKTLDTRDREVSL